MRLQKRNFGLEDRIFATRQKIVLCPVISSQQLPNACVVEEVPETTKEFWTECRYWLNRKICGKKTRIRFECCEGFEQMDGEDGCTLVKPLRNLLETAEALGATKWAAYIRDSGLQNEFESAGAFTLFAPTNEAFDSIRGSLRSQMDSYRGNPNNPILLYHIVPTKLRSDDFEGDQVVETRHQGHNLRINKYSNGMTTINCNLLVRKDQEASNGIVHIIDGVLDPSLGIATNVADMDARFRVLAEMLNKSGYINVLRTLQDSITILAPSDEAFQKLADSRREKIINDREARLALLQNHVIPHVICESAITGEHKVRTMSSNKLTFTCDIDGAYVETTKLHGEFNLGKNGIVHVIDDVLLPDRAKNLVELAESRQLRTFVDFVKRSGLEETLSHTGDYTFFVPDENAWLEMPPEALAQARRDPEYAGLMLRFHGAYGRHLTNSINDNQGIMSLDEENPVRLQVWRRALGVENAKITDSDLEAQNGVIHIINKVELSRIMSSPEELRNLITSHIAINMFPETAFEPGLIYSIDGLSSNFKVKKNNEGKLTVNGANVLSSHMSANGVIHVVDKVFKPSDGESYASVKRTSISTVTHRNGTTSTRTFVSTSKSSGRTHHRRVTVNEGYGKDIEEILPAFPQGSVIVGSTQRKAEIVYPPTKASKGRKSHRRESLKKHRHRVSKEKNTSTFLPFSSTTSDASTTSAPPTTTTSTPLPTTTSTTTTTSSTTVTESTTSTTTPSTTGFLPPVTFRITTYYYTTLKPSYKLREEHESLYRSQTSKDRTADINFQIVRGSRVPVAYNNNSMYDMKYFSKTYENYGSKKPLEHNLKIHSSNDNEYKEVVDQSDLSIPVPYSKKSVYSDYANIGKVNSQGYVRTQ
ncbi:Periostin, partial [Armadillidium nasatum]